MRDPRIRPGRYWYVVAGAVFAGAAGVFVYGLVTFLSATFAAMGQPMVMPGPTERVLDAPGVHNVYYEQHCVIGGIAYDGPAAPSGFSPSIVEKATGQKMTLRATQVHARCSYNGRRATLLWDFEAPRAGAYIVSGDYVQGGGRPPIALSIGPEIGTQRIIRFVATCAVWAVGEAAAILTFVITLVRRRRAKKRLRCVPPLPTA